MTFQIKRLGNAFVVEDSAGNRHSEPSTFESAIVTREAILAAALERAANDPEVQERRRSQAAYRAVEADPELRPLKNFLPRKGEIERNTRRSYESTLALIGSCMSITSSDPKVHAELNKSPEQRMTRGATRKRQQLGAATREAVVERWKALADVAQHKRASRIATEMQIDVRHVRRLLK